MEKEHLTVIDLETGYFRLVPDEGYRVRRISLPEKTYSEAVTKTPQDYEAVASEIR